LVIDEPTQLAHMLDEFGILRLDVLDVVEILVEEIQPIRVVFPSVVEHASGLVDEKAVAVDEVRALEKALEKEPPEAIDAGFIEPAGKLAFAAQGLRVATVYELALWYSYLRSAHDLDGLCRNRAARLLIVGWRVLSGPALHFACAGPDSAFALRFA
jgi:hypothetical protein